MLVLRLFKCIKQGGIHMGTNGKPKFTVIEGKLNQQKETDEETRRPLWFRIFEGILMFFVKIISLIRHL